MFLEEMFSEHFARTEYFFAFAAEPLATMHLGFVSEPFMPAFEEMSSLGTIFKGVNPERRASYGGNSH
jgi:hypothetical protein